VSRPDSLQEVAKRAKTELQRFRIHLDEFLDDFYLDSPAGRRARLAPRPDFLGDAKMDAWLCAVGEHLARRWRLPIPRWTTDPAGKGPETADYGTGEDMVGLRRVLERESPPSFRRRNIFVEAEPLRRARFPRKGRRSTR
jgi:hypothetical protein